MTCTDSPVVDNAMDYLLETLKRHDNTVSEEHAAALRGLLELAHGVSSGNLRGRFRFGLPCGMGKTTAVRAFIRAATKLSFSPIENSSMAEGDNFEGIVVACSKVEQLCALKRHLINDDGVSPELIGLMHSYSHDPKAVAVGRDGYATEPSEGHDRPILLVTHANVKAGDVKPWMRSRPDALLFYDETLVAAEGLTVTLINDRGGSLNAEVGALARTARLSPSLQPFATWAASAVDGLLDAVAAHQAPNVLTLESPKVSPEDAAAWLRLPLMLGDTFAQLKELIRLTSAGDTMRVFTDQNKQRSLLSYTISVPEELQNIIVLDASDPVRKLVHHDHRMQLAEDVIPSLSRFKGRSGGLASTKRYDHVKVFFAKEAAGRGKMSEQFSEAESDHQPSWAIEKLVRLVQSKPTESFLIFTYKDKAGVKYLRTLQRAMERAGIDPAERLPGTDDLRINITTWGKETATNEYSYCQNVVLLGVYFQPRPFIAATYLGQVDNPRAPAMDSLARDLQYDECVHSIYQAASRGAMRRVDVIDGQTQAKPCNLYVAHNDGNLQRKLDVVMAGAQWSPWREPGEDMVYSEVAMLIRNELSRLEAAGVSAISLRRLKADVAPSIPGTTFQRARDSVLASDGCSWMISGRSLTRREYGFVDETSPLDQAANF